MVLAFIAADVNLQSIDPALSQPLNISLLHQRVRKREPGSTWRFNTWILVVYIPLVNSTFFITKTNRDVSHFVCSDSFAAAHSKYLLFWSFEESTNGTNLPKEIDSDLERWEWEDLHILQRKWEWLNEWAMIEL